MRMVTYNILNGGEGRADPLAEVLLAQRADIVALVEADHPEVLERIARRLSMDFVVAPGASHSVALLSRWPIVQSVNRAAVAADGRPPCFLEAVVRDPSGFEWNVGVAHLHPRAAESDEELRVVEVEWMLSRLESHRAASRVHLLAGDFNANSPIQHIDPERCKDATREAWRRNGGYIPRRAIQRLLEADYVDTLHACRGDRTASMGSFTTQHPGQRMDYIFAHGLTPLQIRDAWIEQDRLAKYASDHFPVGAELML